MNRELEERLEGAWKNVRQCAENEDLTYRESAYTLAVSRVKEATELLGF